MPASKKTTGTKSRKHRSKKAAAKSTAAAASTGDWFDPRAVKRRCTTRNKATKATIKQRLDSYDKAVAERAHANTDRASGPLMRRRTRANAVPLRILAEGDSWFDFPFGGRPLRNGDVIAQLEEKLHLPIMNLAMRGDEVRGMLGVNQRRVLRKHLADRSRDFNVLLFSGGGNDLVGEQLCLWIRTRDSVRADYMKAVNELAFAHALGVVAAGYEQLIDLRDDVLRETPGRRIHVFLHQYDFAIPSGNDVCGVGPWLKPSFDFRGWTNQREAQAIMKIILQKFAAMLGDLAQRRNDVHVVETQGTVVRPQLWNDELHLTRAGFGRIADKFHETMKEKLADLLAP